jgi:hypothetical protein
MHLHCYTRNAKEGIVSSVDEKIRPALDDAALPASSCSTSCFFCLSSHALAYLQRCSLSAKRRNHACAFAQSRASVPQRRFRPSSLHSALLFCLFAYLATQNVVQVQGLRSTGIQGGEISLFAPVCCSQLTPVCCNLDLTGSLCRPLPQAQGNDQDGAPQRKNSFDSCLFTPRTLAQVGSESKAGEEKITAEMVEKFRGLTRKGSCLLLASSLTNSICVLFHSVRRPGQVVSEW